MGFLHNLFAKEKNQAKERKTPEPRGFGQGADAIHLTLKISGAIHGSAAHVGSYDVTLPLDMAGPQLLNTIAARIIRPNGPVMYYTGYQLYGPWGNEALTCDGLSPKTLRTLGAKDGDVVRFIDWGGSFI
jgi:hypothetical protein